MLKIFTSFISFLFQSHISLLQNLYYTMLMKSCIMILYHANYFQSTRRYNYIGYTLNYSITCLQIKKLAVSMLQDCEYANYSSDFVP